MKRLVLALVLLLPVVGLADFDAGGEAYERGDYATAMREWRPLAEAGDAKSQDAIGMMYSNGFGVSEDDAEAVKWLRLAAEQGHAGAQGKLGAMYSFG
jgi:TPR repeat protein